MPKYRLVEGAPELSVAAEHRTSSVAREMSVLVLAARFNDFVVDRLLDGALDAWERHGGLPSKVTLARVPGAYELPLAAKRFAASGRYDCVVALGCVIRGDTPHFEYVAGEAARGISQAALDTGVPVAFGVLTVETPAQAEERADPARMNKGGEAMETALEMALLLSQA
jgi:6,7-dimethyl-8-ribityllumazine synthase